MLLSVGHGSPITSSRRPYWTTRPASITATRSTQRKALRRWVTTRQVQDPLERASCSAASTKRSERRSKAEVASSKTSILGWRASARAMQTRCFCPPLSAWPRSPAGVSRPAGSSATNSSTRAVRRACCTAASWASVPTSLARP
mmetsp:Transcript_105217/g.224771  ORF Transcript_105217/g.224771 Transcript_105217/m.224771 type:complete len:144 (+) Transcript_105217:112-543(+)